MPFLCPLFSSLIRCVSVPVCSLMREQYFSWCSLFMVLCSAGVLKLCLELTEELRYRWRAKPAWSLLAEGRKLTAVWLILPGGVQVRILKHLLREVCNRSTSGNRDVITQTCTYVSVKTEIGQSKQNWHHVQLIRLMCDPLFVTHSSDINKKLNIYRNTRHHNLQQPVSLPL